MKLLILLLLLLLPSCSSLHMSSGIIDPAFGGQVKSPHSLSAVHTSIQAESTWENENFVLSVGAGPAITVPADQYTPIYGAEISNRIAWKATKHIHPYLYHSHGIHFHESKWYWEEHVAPVEPQGSDSSYELSTRIGAGVGFQVSEQFLITIDYSWIHFSSGMTFHGDKTRQFFGLKKATVNDGFESSGIFLGVQYEF